MIDPIEKQVNEWEVTEGESIRDVNDIIRYLDGKLYYDYEPLLGPSPSFLYRLKFWLDNVQSTEDKLLLFKTIPLLFYVGREELNALYREAYESIVKRWITDDLNINIFSQNINEIINQEIEVTWFCPLTDSLRINQFYHINHIPSKCADYRPDWRSLRKFANPKLVKDYVSEKGIKRIVLLEDFVGDGSQVAKAVEFAGSAFSEIPVLVIPLIICPKGMENSRLVEKRNPNISIQPVMSLSNEVVIPDEVEDEIIIKLLELANRVHPNLLDGRQESEEDPPYSYLGYKQTKALIILHTNTPNNTLPIVHYKSPKWEPLFLRHQRVQL